MAEDGTRGLMDVSWAVADLLRGSMASHHHRKVILPFALLRRMDCRRRQEAGPLGKATVSEGGSWVFDGFCCRLMVWVWGGIRRSVAARLL
ncbi:type I restriction-modification system subunit M N-terminal domain-containing protein, partial [Streptomyces sp. NPDC013012]|uniref:type I restriction-modification system subunit M N-terminal domain-containing protein n=1 Tax=Streptomyces sp. NPDC013012 TaxID=3364860 RepID=UPI00369F217C